ncbi:hypothetical protein G0Q06_10075 [Puniceicoccales bacterium CK1056]|uniref:Uncharacterized protein n=1 Tax=Oceanipulchritudo coccoides TaxID=2706888 RepID=A0A6B2M3Y3_9BACT|nr:endo-1,3-alpha-glucanase family glycosylhydrolase [Oceanipulchritudo coccoides]NDV62797.1 hypothetical protein [Oceanipulchritudo coccoides]
MNSSFKHSPGMDFSTSLTGSLRLVGVLSLFSVVASTGYSADQSFLESFEDSESAIVPRFSGGHGIAHQELSISREKSKRGDASLKCEFSFKEKGWIIYQAARYLPGGAYPGSLKKGDRLSFYTNSEPLPAMVNVQVVDANGEFFQQNFDLSSHGWTKRRLKLTESGLPHHWNGDGKLDFPLSQINLTVNMDHAGSGLVYIDEFMIEGDDLTNVWPPVDHTAGGKYSQERVDAALALFNRPILDKPLVEGKHILAHNMASLFDDHTPDLAFLVREYYDKDGSTAELGGYIQYLPYIDFREGSPLGPRSPKEAAKFEIEAAIACGLDGFQFYYPFGEEAMLVDYVRTIRAHFDALEEMDVDFKLTLCFANANHPMSEKDKITRWAKYTRELIESTPEEFWLKTPDGRHIFFTWMADGLADEIPNSWDVQYNPALVKFSALAMENLTEALGVEAAWVYFFLKLDEGVDPEFTSEMLNYFPAVWPWAQYDYRHHEKNLYDEFAHLTEKRNRGFFYSSALDFYSSKTYPTGTWDLIFDIEQAKQLGVHGQYRHYMEMELTRSFRQTMERGIKQDAGIINVVTWNDYAEGHHLAPGANRNFSFAMILNYYREKWLNPDYQVEEDKAAVFFKKYRHDVKPVFDYEMHSEGHVDLSAADFIEVVTLLTEPADVFINGTRAGTAKAGIDAVRIPSEVGPVRVEVKRAGEQVLDLVATEAITDKPHRTDRHTYGYSTVEEDYIQKVFGDDRRSILPSQEYK